MRRFGILAFLGLARANFDNFYFSANGSCPGIYFSCSGPDSVCAHDAVLDKYYCCSGEDYPVCRDGPNTCAAANNQPSESQISCGSGDDTWCCLSDVESCTQRTGQINVCHSTDTNILANVSTLALNQTFSSLSSANPSATAFTFDATQLAAEATSSSSSSSSSSSPTSSTSSTASPSAPADLTTPLPTAQPSSSDSLSGGAIAGIAIGAIAAAALVLAVIIFLLRLRKRGQAAAAMAAASANDNKPFSGGNSQYLPLSHPPAVEMGAVSVGGGGGGGREPHAYASSTTAYGKLAPAQGVAHTYVSELDGERAAHELGGEREVAEMDAEPVEFAGAFAPRKPGTP